jgi:homoserine O-acetyltransferase
MGKGMSDMAITEKSTKLGTTKLHQLGSMQLESGRWLHGVEIAYETYGTLSPSKDNIVWVCHALTGDQYAAGDHPPGWWSNLIGPGRYVDTNRFFVVCTNVLGGCSGTTGPSSTQPETGKPYGLRFPTITIRDMVKAQQMMVRQWGLDKLYAIIGGSVGGMQVLEWAVMYPELMEKAIPMATSSRLSAMAIAYNDVGRQSILADPDLMDGDYYPEPGPLKGFSIARMIGMITYRTQELYDARFGRELKEDHEITQFDSTFQVESYLRYQGEKLVDRFDANSYLYLLKAMDSHDLGRHRGGVEAALEKIQSNMLFVGVTDDLLYPVNHIREVVDTLRSLGKKVDLYELDSPFGHDAFLVEFDEIGPEVKAFLNS